MAREIIISLINFDWGIAVPFAIFLLFCIALIRDVDKDYKQNKIKEKENSRY